MTMEFNQRKLGIVLIVFSLLLGVLLVYVKADMDVKDTFLCEAVEENPLLEMNQCPVHKSNASWYLFFAVGIAFLVFTTGTYLYFFPYKKQTADEKQKQTFSSVNTSKLSEEEQKIYALLTEHHGSLYQSDIMKELGCSKVKVTRLLDKMEHQEILERKRRGMTNIIVLK